MRKLVLIMLLVIIAGGTLGCSNPNGDYTFEDPVLETLLRQSLDLREGPLSQEDLLTVTHLDGEGLNIQSLKGIDQLRNLESLNLRDNKIVDLEPLARLSMLRELDLRSNLIHEVQSLDRLFSLQELDLRGNLISDISGLSGLVRLTSLNLRDNMISDIYPLTNLVLLRELNIRENSIVDLASLASMSALEDLNCRDNYIVDISPLGGLRNLTRRLYLDRNPISDFRPLEEIYHGIAEKDFAVELEFSLPGGVYAEAVEVEIYTFVDQGIIYYTLDGSEPDPIANASNTRKYQEPLVITQRMEPNLLSTIQTTYHHWQGPPRGPVFKATPLRAKLFTHDQPIGHSVAHSYFVSNPLVDYSLPVISLTTNAENMFDPKIGIYVPGDRYREDNVRTGNSFGRGNTWERLAHMEFYEADGTLAFQQEIGIRIHGGITRAWPQKSLRLYARSEYGQSTFDYPVFPDQSRDSFKRLLLRSSGNDMRLSFFRDALAQSLLVETTNLDLQAYRPVIVFLNGEYWGIHNLRERLDDHYLAGKYGVDKDDVVILTVDAAIVDGSPGDQRHYTDMLNFIRRNDITDPDVYAAVNTMMDVENFIDYQIAQIYFDNTDWPFNNIQYWRVKTEQYQPDAPYGLDGRWRWMVYDTDYGFALAEPPDHNTLEWATSRDVPGTFLLRSLLQNPEFESQFINRFADHLNTTFASEHVLKSIQEMKAVLEPEMEEHIHRWPYISSIRAWERNINVMRDFAYRRPDYVRGHITEVFQLPGTATVTVSVSNTDAGTVRVNSIEPALPFTGTYFRQSPVDIVAYPAPGYKFVGWSGTSTDSEQFRWIPQGNISIEAIFAPLSE